MADMIFYTRIQEDVFGRQEITIPDKDYKGRRLPLGKMCKVEITQVEE